jgi:hypothetical protein
MSLWHPNDLVSDADLLGYERSILTQHGASEWRDRRQKVLDDWLFPLLEGRGFPPDRLRTRAAPDKVWSVSTSTYTDQTSTSQNEGGLDLSTLLGSSKYLLIGSKTGFRGLSFRMLAAVNAATVTASVGVWADRYVTATLTDGTLVGQTPLARGGAVTWAPIEGVVKRKENGSDAMYWAKYALSGAPTASTAVGPVSVIRRSRLVAAATFRTLELIYREAPVSQEGPWNEKAEFYAKQAEAAWLRVADQIGPEFDTDGDDSIDGDENNQTAEAVTGNTPFSFERA